MSQSRTSLYLNPLQAVPEALLGIFNRPPGGPERAERDWSVPGAGSPAAGRLLLLPHPLAYLQPVTAKGKTQLAGFNFDGLRRASGQKGHHAGNPFSPGVAGADNLLFLFSTRGAFPLHPSLLTIVWTLASGRSGCSAIDHAVVPLHVAHFSQRPALTAVSFLSGHGAHFYGLPEAHNQKGEYNAE